MVSSLHTNDSCLPLLLEYALCLSPRFTLSHAARVACIPQLLAKKGSGVRCLESLSDFLPQPRMGLPSHTLSVFSLITGGSLPL